MLHESCDNRTHQPVTAWRRQRHVVMAQYPGLETIECSLSRDSSCAVRHYRLTLKSQTMPALKINRTSATKLRNGGRTTHFEMCVSEGDPALIVEILGDIARAHGVAKLAQETGLSNEYLDQLISPEGSPEFSAIITLVKALGLSLHARNR